MYDIQIEVNGSWRWAGVEPNPIKYGRARELMVVMAREPYWTRTIGATRFRVRPVPGYEPKPGPRELARAAKAERAQLHSQLLLTQRALGDAEALVRELQDERDEARKTVEELAARLGFEVEW